MSFYTNAYTYRNKKCILLELYVHSLKAYICHQQEKSCLVKKAHCKINNNNSEWFLMQNFSLRLLLLLREDLRQCTSMIVTCKKLIIQVLSLSFACQYRCAWYFKLNNLLIFSFFNLRTKKLLIILRISATIQSCVRHTSRRLALLEVKPPERKLKYCIHFREFTNSAPFVASTRLYKWACFFIIYMESGLKAELK